MYTISRGLGLRRSEGSGYFEAGNIPGRPHIFHQAVSQTLGGQIRLNGDGDPQRLFEVEVEADLALNAEPGNLPGTVVEAPVLTFPVGTDAVSAYTAADIQRHDVIHLPMRHEAAHGGVEFGFVRRAGAFPTVVPILSGNADVGGDHLAEVYPAVNGVTGAVPHAPVVIGAVTVSDRVPDVHVASAVEQLVRRRRRRHRRHRRTDGDGGDVEQILLHWDFPFVG